MAESYLNRQKTLWEKEKLLITSNFSFARNVFKRIELQGLFGKGLILDMGRLSDLSFPFHNCLSWKKLLLRAWASLESSALRYVILFNYGDVF